MTTFPLRVARTTVCALAVAALLASCGGGGGGGGGDSPAAPGAGNRAATGVVNQAPQIATTAQIAAVVGTAYRIDVSATDPNGDTLSYSLTQAPGGMAIDATSGLITWTPAAGQTGNHAVTVRVADPSGLAATQTFAVSVVAASAAPQITTTPVTTAVVGAAYNYALNATDANGDQLAYSLTQAPGGMTIDAASGLIAWTPSAAQAGTQAVTVRVADAGGLAVEQAFAVAVVSGNAAPQIVSTPLATAVAGAAYSYTVNASDPNGDTLAYSLLQAPGGMSINAASGLIAWTPSPGQAGNQAVTVRVADPGGLAATQAFSVSVSVAVPNAAPQITSTPATTALAGTAYRYGVVATDSSGDALTYSLTQAPSGMTINAASGLISWTPSSGQTGNQAVTVRVADPGGLAATQAFAISVINVAPQVNSTPLVVAVVGAVYSYDVNATDPNGDALTYSLTQAPSGMTINAATGLIAWTPLSQQAGSQTVTVRVADPAGLAATQTFSVSVGGGTRVDMATPATYSAPAGTTAAITLNWSRITMAANYMQFMHLVNAAGQTWSVDDRWTTSATWSAGHFTETRTITVPAGMPSGVYDIRVGLAGGNPWDNLLLAVGPAVTDPVGDRRYRVGSMTVVGNLAPQISSAPVTTAAAGTAYSYGVVATDPDGDPLSYSLTQAPSGMTINASSGTIAWTPTPAQIGSQAVTVRVADNRGLAATQAFSIAVTSNAAPQITSAPVTAATAGAPYSYDVNATDPNGDALTYSLTQAPSGMTINAGNGLIAWTPTSGQVGSHGVTVRVADPGGLAATQAFSITVSSASPPPPGAMTMSCADGAGTQCSGETVLRTDYGVALTRSGVQAYGRSTSDMGATNPNLSTAFGLALASGGVAEIRVRKDGNAAPTGVAMLLSNVGILWDGLANRPQIIETFNPTAGRVMLGANGALSYLSLPPSSDLSYYDYVYLGTAATKLNYANNRYFPRSNPPRCEPGGYCAALETAGPQFGSGSWRWGGNDPDWVSAIRNHEDGDVHAGNGLPDANGNPTWLAGGSGFGVPVPGSKGYRSMEHWSYQYANLISWFTQDTINIVEWGGINEHNKNRRGSVAFGDTTDPATVPASGSATYVGVVRGRYSSNGSGDPVPFVGTATVTVNFTTRSVTVILQNTVRSDNSSVAVPVALNATAVLGTGGNANHLSGPASNGTLSGGVGGRLFGPVAAGGSGNGPSEIGGALSLSNAGTGAAALLGFIARKQ